MENFVARLTEMFSFSQVKMVTVLFILLSCSLLFSMIYQMVRIEQANKKMQESYNKRMVALGARMSRSRIKMFSYNEIETFIKSSGLDFMFKGLTPIGYIVIKFVTAFVFAIAGLYGFGLLAGIIAFIIGFVFIDFIAQQSNSGDNRQMLLDLKGVYDTLRIQTRAGIYTSQILSDCFMIVKNKRLREAMMKLTSSITVHNDIEGSLEEFRSKFSNDYIDSLSLIIRQSMVTGLSTQMLEDIKLQMENIENALLLADKRATENKVTFVQLILYISVIAVSAFIAMTAVTQSMQYMA